MVEIELLICLKMDLILNNLQLMMCHKTKRNQTKPSFFLSFSLILFISIYLSIYLSLCVSISVHIYRFIWTLKFERCSLSLFPTTVSAASPSDYWTWYVPHRVVISIILVRAIMRYHKKVFYTMKWKCHMKYVCDWMTCR